MNSSKKIEKFIILISILLLIGSQIQGQVKSLISNSGGRGVIVGKDGVAYKTNPNGECLLVIPDWLFERIKKAPSKYSLKISLRNVPTQILESKITKIAKPQGSTDTPIKLTYKIANGSKQAVSDINTSINKSDNGIVSMQKIGISSFPLSNPNDPNVNVTFTLMGEPVPGAEIYVELEPDDEP